MGIDDGVPEQELTVETAEQFEHLKTDIESLKKDPDPEVWEKWQGAVLLKDEIRRYCEKPIRLIIPFADTPEFLKPASYHLRLGNKYRVNGVDFELSDNNRILRIPPHGIAIVRTLEWVNIPGFLVARWNLKVKAVYKGLIWVGSLQVDSGYQGFLFCPLYNLSNRTQELVYKDPIFTIDFVKTTRFDEDKGSKLWHSERPTHKLGDLDYQPLTSAPAAQFEKMRNDISQAKGEMQENLNQMKQEMKEDIDANETKMDQFRARIDSFQAITFTVLGIIVAALSFVSVSQFTDMSSEDPPLWQVTTWLIVLVLISILTIVLALSVWKVLRKK